MRLTAKQRKELAGTVLAVVLFLLLTRFLHVEALVAFVLGSALYSVVVAGGFVSYIRPIVRQNLAYRTRDNRDAHYKDLSEPSARQMSISGSQMLRWPHSQFSRLAGLASLAGLAVYAILRYATGMVDERAIWLALLVTGIVVLLARGLTLLLGSRFSTSSRIREPDEAREGVPDCDQSRDQQK